MRKLDFLKRIALCLMTLCCFAGLYAAGTKDVVTFNVTRPANSDATTLTSCGLNAKYVAFKMGCLTVDALNDKLSSKDVVFIAQQGTTSTWYSAASFGSFGHTFSTKGYALASNTHRNAALMSKYEGNDILVGHIPAKVTEGTTYSFTQAFVNGTDTLALQFNVTIGQTESVESDQPGEDEVFNHREDYIETWKLSPWVRQNEQTPLQQNYIQVNAGDKITLGASFSEEQIVAGYTARFRWYTRENEALTRYSTTSDFVIEGAEYSDGGYYIMKVVLNKGTGGSETLSYRYYVDVQTEVPGTPFDWTANTPKFSYDFHTEYPDLPQPTKIHKFKQHNGKDAHYVEGEWWVAYWGDNLNPEVDFNNKNAYSNMIKKYDEDFAYIRDHMGWPPDINARMGYKSFVYTTGSGISNDNDNNQMEGGWQSATNIDGRNWPCVEGPWAPGPQTFFKKLL